MNPVLLLTITGSTKKYLLIVLATLIVVTSLPVMAVFALGSSTLSILSFGSGSSESEGLYQGPLVANDNYEWGNCTYWVFYLRQQANDPIPNTWGNASSWAFNARLDGYLIDHTPTVGSIMQISNVDNGLGHVAYVTVVDPITGAWTVS